MRILIKDEGFQEDDLSGAEFLPLAQISEANRFLDLPSNADLTDVVSAFGNIDAIRIPFVSFADGRGFSLARQLRTLGYTGRLRAYGHLISDQYTHARRCGFDEVEIEQSQSQRQPAQFWYNESGWDRLSYHDRLLHTG